MIGLCLLLVFVTGIAVGYEIRRQEERRGGAGGQKYDPPRGAAP